MLTLRSIPFVLTSTLLNHDLHEEALTWWYQDGGALFGPRKDKNCFVPQADIDQGGLQQREKIILILRGQPDFFWRKTAGQNTKQIEKETCGFQDLFWEVSGRENMELPPLAFHGTSASLWSYPNCCLNFLFQTGDHFRSDYATLSLLAKPVIPNSFLVRYTHTHTLQSGHTKSPTHHFLNTWWTCPLPAFAPAVPFMWNALPVLLCPAHMGSSFRIQLKCHLLPAGVCHWSPDLSPCPLFMDVYGEKETIHSQWVFTTCQPCAKSVSTH